MVSEIRAGGGRADAVTADLSVAEGPARLASQVRAIVGDHLDILVSNAGISKAAAIEDHTLEDFDMISSLPMSAVRSFWCNNCCRSAGGIEHHCYLFRRGSHGAGKPRSENPSILAYAATKGAIETLVKNWAAHAWARAAYE